MLDFFTGNYLYNHWSAQRAAATASAGQQPAAAAAARKQQLRRPAAAAAVDLQCTGGSATAARGGALRARHSGGVGENPHEE